MWRLQQEGHCYCAVENRENSRPTTGDLAENRRDGAAEGLATWEVPVLHCSRTEKGGTEQAIVVVL